MFVFIWVDPDAFEVHEVLKYKLTMHFHILDEKKNNNTILQDSYCLLLKIIWQFNYCKIETLHRPYNTVLLTLVFAIYDNTIETSLQQDSYITVSMSNILR